MSRHLFAHRSRGPFGFRCVGCSIRQEDALPGEECPAFPDAVKPDIGLEPMTCRLRSGCSTTELIRHNELPNTNQSTKHEPQSNAIKPDTAEACNSQSYY